MKGQATQINDCYLVDNTFVCCSYQYAFYGANHTSISYVHISSRVPTAASQLRRLVAGLSPRRPGFKLGPVYARFVEQQVLLRELRPSPVKYNGTNAPYHPVIYHKRKTSLNKTLKHYVTYPLTIYIITLL
jgi:hypothetical protein